MMAHSAIISRPQQISNRGSQGSRRFSRYLQPYLSVKFQPGQRNTARYDGVVLNFSRGPHFSHPTRSPKDHRLAIYSQVFLSKQKNLLFIKSYSDSPSSPFIPCRQDFKHHPLQLSEWHYKAKETLITGILRTPLIQVERPGSPLGRTRTAEMGSELLRGPYPCQWTVTSKTVFKLKKRLGSGRMQSS